VRILVYNVRGFRAGPAHVAETVRQLRPDVAFIAECATAGKLQEFAEALGMSAHHGSLLPIARRARNAVLVREPFSVERSEAHLFTNPARFHPRGAFVAVVTGEGQTFTAIAVHLGLSGEERLRHAGELMGVVRHLVRPVLVGGDLNERPAGSAAVLIAGVGQDAWTLAGTGAGATFPAADPSARIDYLFTSEDVQIEAAFVPSEAGVEAASDHLPLAVDLVL